jgi:hypothetical protein
MEDAGPSDSIRSNDFAFKIVDHGSDLRKQWAVWDSNPQPTD